MKSLESQTRRERVSRVRIVRWKWSLLLGGAGLTVGSVVVGVLGLNGNAGLGRNTLAFIIGIIGTLGFGYVTTFYALTRLTQVAGRSNELVIYSFSPWQRTERLTGDLTDLELVIVKLDSSKPTSRVNQARSMYRFSGSVGSIEVVVFDDQVEPGSLACFADWKMTLRGQHGPATPVARDYYSEASKLAEVLRNDANILASWSEELDDAISQSFGSLETLMALRFHIREMLEDPETILDADCRAVAAALAEAIDEALR